MTTRVSGTSISYLRQTAAHGLGSDQARFLIVGGCGFAYEAIALFLITRLTSIDVSLARFLTFPTAVFLTWLCNRHWTFKSEDPERARQFLKYAAVQVGSGVLNVAAFMAVVRMETPAPPALVLVGLVLGSALGLVMNYIGSRWLVFGRTSYRREP